MLLAVAQSRRLPDALLLVSHVISHVVSHVMSHMISHVTNHLNHD